MNASFDYDGVRIYKEAPHLLEAGTPNIADIIAFGKVVEYLNKIGYENMQETYYMTDYNYAIIN